MKTLRRMARALTWPIEKNAAFFAAMYALGVLCAYLTVPATRHAHVYDNLWLELFLDDYAACLVLALWPRSIRLWVRRALYAVLYGVAIVDVFCFWKFGSTITPTMLLLVDETDGREASEFLRTYLSPDVITSPVGWILLLMAVHAAAAILCHCYARRHKAADGKPMNEREALLALLPGDAATRLSAASPKLRAAAAATILALLVWGVASSWNNKRQMTRLMTADTIGTVEHILTEKGHGEFYLPIYRLAFSVYSNHLAARQITRCIQASRRATVDSCSFRSPNIVLIIGESYSKAHCQLYGYGVKDTPRQKRRMATGLLTPFSDVVSCWNLTSFVFKNVFSTHVIGERGEWCDHPLFPELFRKAGYHVTFLTDQFLPKAQEAVYDFSGGFFLNNPILSKALFDTRNTQLHRFDEGLLADYDALAPKPARGGKKRAGKAAPPLPFENARGRLFIFHLIGQHVNYHTRCPDSQRRFTADDYKESRPELGPYKRRMIADYDNACLYNDSVVDQIIRRFEDQDAIVIYMPDHGEEIYEPGRNILCRNHSDAIDWPLAHYEFEIPFWIWCSHKYAVRHPEVFKAVKDAKDRPFMTDAMPHLLLWLAGISTPDYHARYNLLSPDYDASRPRILKNSADYDKLREAARRREEKE